jgi:hypothetical protein
MLRLSGYRRFRTRDRPRRSGYRQLSWPGTVYSDEMTLGHAFPRDDENRVIVADEMRMLQEARPDKHIRTANMPHVYNSK